MCRRSLSRPGLGGLPAAIHFSRDWPPFQARVVKPRISTLTPQRSSVRARMSALIAATVIGRPRVEHALVEVELPGPRLLRHQAALQPVGEPRDDALQVGELLVEQVTQTRQLVGIAQLLGLDGLIATRREGLVEFVVGPASGVA